MKILYPTVIVVIVVATAIGVLIMTTGIFGGIAPSSNSYGYIEIVPQGLAKTYELGQAINFSVLIQGFGKYPCVPPDFVIYNNNDKEKPIFSYRTQSVTCPDPSEHYNLYFPAQNSTFSVTINQTGNYTLDVSLGKDSYQKEFSVIPSANTIAKKSTTHLLDFHVNLPLQIYVKRGETLTVPVDIYGSTISRDVDIVISKSDMRHGPIAEDVKNPQLWQGFHIDFPIKNIQLQAMNITAQSKPLMKVNMTISVDNGVKPGVYPFAINMITYDDPNVYSSGNARAFYVNVE